jgi:cysteinyl-tRNA synthetase
MDDDFNMPRPGTDLDEVRTLIVYSARGNRRESRPAAGLRVMCETQGFNARDMGTARRSVGEESRPSRVGRSKASSQRERARMDKNWQEADRIRDELSSKESSSTRPEEPYGRW